MKALIIWALVAGILNGVLMRIWDFLQMQGGSDANSSVHA